jgi:hypothetical protein
MLVRFQGHRKGFRDQVFIDSPDIFPACEEQIIEPPFVLITDNHPQYLNTRIPENVLSASFKASQGPQQDPWLP